MGRRQCKKDGARWYYSTPKLGKEKSSRPRQGRSQKLSPKVERSPNSLIPIHSVPLGDDVQMPYNAVAEFGKDDVYQPTARLFARVTRVDGVEPLVFKELPKSTNLDAPPADYLMSEPRHGLHLHAPNYQKDPRAAAAFLFQTAAQAEVQQESQIITSAAALKQVFGAAQNPTTSVNLNVQKLGSALFISEPAPLGPSTVAEAREKALLAKTLYHTAALSRPPAVENDLSDAVLTNPRSETAHGIESRGIVSLPARHLAREYANVLRWNLRGLDVFLGVDTPTLSDEGNHLLTLSLKDISQDSSSEAPSAQSVEQWLCKSDAAGFLSRHEALNLWFDAVMTNVRNIAVLIHNNGIVQDYKVLPVSDVIGVVGKMEATSSLNATWNVLKWLVSQCVKDGANYILFRDKRTNAFKLFECNSSGPISCEDQLAMENNTPADDTTLGLVCIKIGHYVVDRGGGLSGISLFFQAFHLLLNGHKAVTGSVAEASDVVEPFLEIFRHLPRLFDVAVSHCSSRPGQTGVVSHEPIEVSDVKRFSEVFEWVGKFAHVLIDSLSNFIVMHQRAMLLDMCRTILQFSVVGVNMYCSALNNYGRQREVRTHPFRRKDAIVYVFKQNATALLRGIVQAIAVLTNVFSVLRSISDPPAISTAKPSSHSSSLAIRHDTIDISSIDAAFSELIGDVYLIVMGDKSEDVVAHIVAETASSLCQNRQSGTKDPITELKAIPRDRTSLSYLALSHYTRASSANCCVLRKTSKVYFLVGSVYTATERYTKALESLSRSKELLRAAKTAALGDQKLSSKICDLSFCDVLNELGRLHCHLAAQYHRSSREAALPTEITATFLWGPGFRCTVSNEEDTEWHKALGSFQEALEYLRTEDGAAECCGLDSCALEAELGLSTLQYASRLVDSLALNSSPSSLNRVKCFVFVEELLSRVQSLVPASVCVKGRLLFEQMRLHTAARRVFSRDELLDERMPWVAQRSCYAQQFLDMSAMCRAREPCVVGHVGRQLCSKIRQGFATKSISAALVQSYFFQTALISRCDADVSFSAKGMCLGILSAMQCASCSSQPTRDSTKKMVLQQLSSMLIEILNVEALQELLGERKTQLLRHAQSICVESSCAFSDETWNSMVFTIRSFAAQQ